jgi:Zn-finger nucleic acid-binding protein
VWLDRGELEKLLEREAGAGRRDEPRREFDDDDRYRKRRSIWGELFD